MGSATLSLGARFGRGSRPVSPMGLNVGQKVSKVILIIKGIQDLLEMTSNEAPLP